MLNRANEACDMVKKHITEDNIIRIISHNDADGISAAAVVANAIKEEGGQFHTSIVSRLTREFVRELAKESYNLFVFSDMGSACLKYINRLKADVIIADHHQPAKIEANANVVHINPHLFGIDGSRELSGSGSSYLAIRELGENGKKHLAYFALIGAFGDMQSQNGFSSVNKLILEDGLESEVLKINEDLKIVSKSEEPLYKSLAYTLNPGLSGLTGDLKGSKTFLEKIGLSYLVKFVDLEGDERNILKDELIKINPAIFANIYTIPKEIPQLRDLEEYAYLLDSCGKNKKFGLGLGICLGEREKALDTAIDLQKKYREQLIKGMEWIKREGSINLNHFQYLYSEDKDLKRIMGTIASVGISIGLLPSDKPILTLARLHDDIKISGRTTREMVEKGVNLGKALDDASRSFGGQGGGHDIAAGAIIPFNQKDNFLNLFNDIVEHQLG
ncbi:MAG: DHH family phosphoesterase [Methanobacteriaceae archaeon]|nr:DHH family phosphoesterase [Candidatus Methanorudis spinitermitis]